MKHKHCELIKLWADGAEIEYKSVYGQWFVLDRVSSSWNENTEYRIKPERVPEPKPDVVQEIIEKNKPEIEKCNAYIKHLEEQLIVLRIENDKLKNKKQLNVDCNYFVDDGGHVSWCELDKANLKLTFDGETGELKSAEVLK